MPRLKITILDDIRDEQHDVTLADDLSVAEVIDGLLRSFGLPRRDFKLQPIDYDLTFDQNREPGEILYAGQTLRHAGVGTGEFLHLVSPVGRQVTQVMDKLLEEINEHLRDEVIDRLTGDMQKKIKDEIWNGLVTRAEEIEQALSEVASQQANGPGHRRGAKTRNDPSPRSRDRYQPSRNWTRKLQWITAGITVAGLIAVIIYKSPEQTSEPLSENDNSAQTEEPPLASPSATPRNRQNRPSGDSGTNSEGTSGNETNNGSTSTTGSTDGNTNDNISPPPNPDPDGDGLTTAEEATYGTDPAIADTDGDGLSDGDEVAGTTKPTLSDSDGDGLSDGEEVLTYKTDPVVADMDADGLSDSQEVFGSTNPAFADSDEDGLSDGEEVSVFGTDPTVADTDGDGLLDGKEAAGTSKPTAWDSDGDGLSDGQEVSTYGTDPGLPDTDGDGWADGVEINQKSNPLDPFDPPG